MTPSRLVRYGGLILALLVLALTIGSILLWDDSKTRVFTKYRAIASGMTPIEIRRLMHDGGDVMRSGVGTAEIWHIDGRYMIAVEYEPNPDLPASTINPVRPLKDDWVAKRKVLVELGRGSRLDPLLVQLQLWKPRIVEQDRVR